MLIDNLYHDPAIKDYQKKDSDDLIEQCQIMWSQELRNLHFLSDKRKRRDIISPVVIGGAVSVAKSLIDLYAGYYLIISHSTFD